LDENSVERLFFGHSGRRESLLQCFADNLKFVMPVKVVAFGIGVTANLLAQHCRNPAFASAEIGTLILT
jgi:hypothetical protein